MQLEKEDFLENLHVFFCFDKLTKRSVTLSCVLDLALCSVFATHRQNDQPGMWEEGNAAQWQHCLHHRLDHSEHRKQPVMDISVGLQSNTDSNPERPIVPPQPRDLCPTKIHPWWSHAPLFLWHHGQACHYFPTKFKPRSRHKRQMYVLAEEICHV